MDTIIAALEEIKEQGTFFGKRTTSIDTLDLKIKEFGSLKFPIAVQDINALISLAKPAKFGWRDKTLLDKEVRDAWEISKDNIDITDSNKWNKELKSTLELLKNDLGLPESAALTASLHNLLIYEPGQFFSPHQDSEKLDGMVASLIIVLPSMHSGGNLIIDHHGFKKQFQTSRFPLDKLTFIAFYSDCHHEVKAITKGYRVALTYNLVLENQNTRTENTKVHDNLIQELRNYFSNEINHEHPQKLIYLLDHNYTQKGLSWDLLKNADSLRAKALKQAASALDLEIFMTLADVQETWNCETDYDDYRYRGKRKHYDDDSNNDDVQLIDLVNSDTTLRHWIDIDNIPVDHKDCYISDDQICWTKATNEFKPFDTEYEGWMGNYGDTMERWYHRAAIILWKKKDHYPVLFEMDADAVLKELLNLAKKKSNEPQLSAIINNLLPYWSSQMHVCTESSRISTVLKLAIYVNDSQLAHTMLINFDIKALNPKTTKLVLELGKNYGTTWCLEILKKWSKLERYGRSLKCENISQIVQLLSENQRKNSELTSWLLSYHIDEIKKHNAFSIKHDDRVQIIKNNDDRKNEIIYFIKACHFADNAKVHIKVIDYMIANTELYPIFELTSVIHFLKNNLDKNNHEKFGYNTLLDYVIEQLQNEQIQGLRNKNDWSIKEKWSCVCDDCKTLNTFLLSRNENEKIWPLAQGRRQHIHQIIDGLGIPVTHETERTGSPFKLILKKTDKLFKQAKIRFEKLGKELSLLTDKVEI